MAKRITCYANQRTIDQLENIKERWEAAAADAGTKYSYSEIIKILIECEFENIRDMYQYE